MLLLALEIYIIYLSLFFPALLAQALIFLYIKMILAISPLVYSVLIKSESLFSVSLSSFSFGLIILN